MDFLTVTILNSFTVLVQWSPQATPQSYEIEIQTVDTMEVPIMEITLCGNTTNKTIMNLAAGKQYQFLIRPIYEDGILGTEVSTIQATTESGKLGHQFPLASVLKDVFLN